MPSSKTSKPEVQDLFHGLRNANVFRTGFLFTNSSYGYSSLSWYGVLMNIYQHASTAEVWVDQTTVKKPQILIGKNGKAIYPHVVIGFDRCKNSKNHDRRKKSDTRVLKRLTYKKPITRSLEKQWLFHRLPGNRTFNGAEKFLWRELAYWYLARGKHLNSQFFCINCLITLALC